MNDAPRCTYIRITGHRCGSPALKGEHFCFFHTRMVKGVRYRIDQHIMPSAVLENAEAVQVGLMDVISQLLEQKMHWREASLIIRALEVAARNVRRVRFGQDIEDMVRQLPNWEAQFFDEHPEHAPENWQEERNRSQQSSATVPPKKTCPHPANGAKNLKLRRAHSSQNRA